MSHTQAQILEEFCSTLDTRFLNLLDQQNAVLLTRICVFYNNDPLVRHDVIDMVLSHYNVDGTGRRLGLKDRGREKAEQYVSKMSVSVTGAHAGNVLVANSPGIQGAAIRIHNGFIPPERTRLDTIRAYPPLWNTFITKLGSYTHFSGMSRLAREIWLEMTEASNENSIGQNDRVRIEVIQPGTGDFAMKLTEDQLDQLMQGNPNSADGYWDAREIENMFPRKPGSQAVRHVLVLIRSFWKIATDFEQVSRFDDVVIDLDDGGVLEGSDTGRIFVLPGFSLRYEPTEKGWERPVGAEGTQKVGFVTDRSSLPISQILDSIPAVRRPRAPNSTEVRSCSQYFIGFTPAAHKSLLQKIIRYRSEVVITSNGDSIPAADMLLASMAHLAAMPGSFVPDIQRYVSGLEAVAKRVGITIYEDSFLPEERRGATMVMLMAGSVVAQRVKSWSPSLEVLTKWFAAGLRALESVYAVDVDFRAAIRDRPFVVGEEYSDLQNASALLDNLRSFDTDLGLARAWATASPDFNLVTQPHFPRQMRLERCVDHHWAPGFAHYFDIDYINSLPPPSRPSLPFQPLFSRTWDASSGFNPRRASLVDHEIRYATDIPQIERAQKLYLSSKQSTQATVDRPDTGMEYSFRYPISIAWVAALVGPIEVKVRKLPSMLVTLSPDNPADLIVIRRPSRDMSTDPLTDEQKEAALREARKTLRAGIPMNSATAPIEDLKNSRWQLVGDEYVVRKTDGERVGWDEVSNPRFVLCVHPWDASSIEYALLHRGNGVSENADERLMELCGNTPTSILQRALTYLNRFSPTIEMNRISQEGGSNYRAVSLTDVGAYQFILQLTVLYPAAIAPMGPSRFKVGISPLLWLIRDRVAEFLRVHSRIEEDPWRDIQFEDTQRTLWPHQNETVQDMLKNHDAGLKGNMLWLKVGMGKTACILTFLSILKDRGQLPPMIVYTLPESAIKSVIREIRYFGVPINLIIPLVDIRKRASRYQQDGTTVSKSCVPKTGTINLIEHDHLRRCEDVLCDNGPSTFFIVDEVHKTMNDTKRSSVALQIADLAVDFCVFTGTPVIDMNTYKLIGWLERVVDFEVNDTNLLVAANAMIAKKISTGIRTVYHEIFAAFTSESEGRYQRLVPPALGGHNPNPTTREWESASSICYQACTTEMSRVVTTLLGQNRGVMVVAKDSKHQIELKNAILETSGIPENDIFLLEPGDSILLDDEAVESGNVHNFKVVIVPVRRAEGYTLTRLSAMVTSVYPTNNAVREQIEGRINRQGQRARVLDYYIVYAGLLENLMRAHNSAKSLSIALQGLAQSI